MERACIGFLPGRTYDRVHCAISDCTVIIKITVFFCFVCFSVLLQQHDRHHTMLANPYDPSRDLSPNLPTTSCRGQELTNVFGSGGGLHGQCCTFKSEFDDDCSPECCISKVSPPTPMMGLAGNDYRGGPLAIPCKQERDQTVVTGLIGLGSTPVEGHHHHHQRHQNSQHHLQHTAVIGYGSPEPSPSPGIMSSYGAYESPPDNLSEVRPKQEDSEVNLCDGCGLKILDRYYLFAVDKRWHATCLQCSQCSRTLATDTKCFYRDGNIYCKSDYQR